MRRASKLVDVSGAEKLSDKPDPVKKGRVGFKTGIV